MKEAQKLYDKRTGNTFKVTKIKAVNGPASICLKADKTVEDVYRWVSPAEIEEFFLIELPATGHEIRNDYNMHRGHHNNGYYGF